LKIEKIDYLHGNIIIFSIGAWKQKLCPNKFKIGEKGQGKKFENLKNKFLISFSYIIFFSTLEALNNSI